MLTATGSTNARRYSLRDYVSKQMKFAVTPDVEEHVVWRERVSPLLKNELVDNVLEICEHGVNEMLNNVIFHSGGTHCYLSVCLNVNRVSIDIHDDGIGIFEKIRTSYNLGDSRLALLELSKGKLTTDPDGQCLTLRSQPSRRLRWRLRQGKSRLSNGKSTRRRHRYPLRKNNCAGASGGSVCGEAARPNASAGPRARKYTGRQCADLDSELSPTVS